jgi:hypothetical protein
MKYTIPMNSFDTLEEAMEGLAEFLKPLPIGVGASIKGDDGTFLTGRLELVFDNHSTHGPLGKIVHERPATP